MLSLSAYSKPLTIRAHFVELNNIHDTVPVASDTMIAEKIYESVEAEAYFPGQEPAWHSFLQQNLNPSVPVDKGQKLGYTLFIYNL